MRKLLLIGLLLVLAAACTAEQREALQTMVAAPTLSSQASTAATPEISVIELPTTVPTMGGPLGTMTAIADLVATPELDNTPYVIARRGNPHFIEFHAWW